MSVNEIPSSDPGAKSFCFGRFQLKVDQNVPRLFAEDHAIALSTAESTILLMLLEKRGEFVKTEDLLKSIAPSSVGSENLVHGAVRGLRRTLNDADLIKNERSKGYCFTGAVARSSDVSAGATLSEATTAIPNLANLQPAPKSRDPFVVVALLVTAPVVLLPFGLVLFGGNWESLPRQLGFIQALMILVALGYDFYFAEGSTSTDASNETRRALRAVQQLRRFWRLLLASWCCLYITLPFSQWLSADATSWEWQALQVTTTLLNNCSALMLVLGYLVLNRPTVIRVADRNVDDVSVRPGLFGVGGIAVLEAMLLILSARLGRPNLTVNILFAFDLMSGVAGGIAMALFISRLDSRLLGTRGLLPIIPAVLYFYVVIQPFYPLINRTFPNRFGASQHFDLWIIQLAFMLKAVMYIYVTELFRTQRFLFYMIHARRIYENVESSWHQFNSGKHS